MAWYVKIHSRLEVCLEAPHEKSAAALVLVWHEVLENSSLMLLPSEPCIRGHRSTKCTHANERLMVPVRKPGRPLSACPHPPNAPCGCGSVTAAIPRKQACHCGPNTPSDTRPTTSSSSSDAPSPTKYTFKVEKAKPSSGRKQSMNSMNSTNLERMDINQINVLSQQNGVSMAFPNGYIIPTPTQMYGFAPQIPNFAQFNHVQMQSPPHLLNMISQNGINGYSNGAHANGGLEHVIESPLATPTGLEIKEWGKQSKLALTNGTTKPPKAGSCCAPKPKVQIAASSSSSVSVSSPPQPKVSSCCASKKDIKSESTTSSGRSTPQISHQTLPNNVMPFGQPLSQHFPGPQPTLFTYPATYGSFQNPLQPQAWRQNMETNGYSQLPVSIPTGPLPFTTPTIPENLDTIHSCCCGDACQCIGCAAHPYNDATQDYVRSAWASMSPERPSSETYINGQTPTNGNSNMAAQNSPLDNTASSPTAHTPSSTTSNSGEEQSLSAADFFFVNYPFTADGCGGDTQGCPCGDDCQCLGCTIHRQPPISCSGEKESCECGDDCKCVGCEFHGNA